MADEASKKRLTIPDVLPEFLAYYRDNPVWGSLHIVLEDHNVEDGSVQYCVKRARETGDAAGERLAGLLLGMTKTQRGRLADVVRKAYAAESHALGPPVNKTNGR